MSFTLAPDATGILPDRMIAAMADAGLILPEYPFRRKPDPAGEPRPPLGQYRVSRAGFVPARTELDGRGTHR